MSSVLIKIWDLAARSPSGILARDAYRSIKAIGRRAKELGRNVGAYTLELFCKLTQMGKGVVEKNKRLTTFTVLPSTSIDSVTKVTQPQGLTGQGFSLSPTESVTLATDVGNCQTVADANVDIEIPRHNNESLAKDNNSDDTASGKVPFAPTQGNSSDGVSSEDPPGDPLSDEQLQSWLDRIAACANVSDCMACLEELNRLKQPVAEKIWLTAEPLLPRFWESAEIEIKAEMF